jgi:Zn-dependent protease
MFNGLNGLEIVFVLASIILSMSFHEAMHAFTAHWLGDTTARDEGRLSLNPLKHIDLFTTILLPLLLIISHVPPFFAAKPVPFNPDRVKYDEYGAALVGVAGPLTNLALAIISGLILRFGFHSYGSTAADAILIFTEVNVSFFVFNMIPFPPLDGSRLLYAFAPEPLQEIMIRIERLGFAAIIVFMLLVFTFIAPIINNISTHILKIILGV